MLRATLIVLFFVLLAQPAYAATYGPVKTADNLWNIAAKYRPTKNTTVQQVMVAFVKANPSAFHHGNINLLKRGVHLKIPTRSAILNTKVSDAFKLVALHNKQFRRKNFGKQIAPTISSSQPAANTTKSEATSSTELLSMRDEIAALRKDREQLTEQVTHLRTELNKIGDRINSQEELRETVADQKEEITELQSLIAQKDTHIESLQASLKSASEAIKSQHADNLRLFNKLKEISPELTSNMGESALSAPTAGDSVKLTEMLGSSQGQTNSEPTTLQALLTKEHDVSPYALWIAALSFLFISIIFVRSIFSSSVKEEVNTGELADTAKDRLIADKL